MRLETIHLLSLDKAPSSPLIAVQIMLLNTSFEHKSGSLVIAVQFSLLNSRALISEMLLHG